MKLNKPLNYGGRLWGVGERVTGRLPMDFIQELQKNGALDEDSEEINQDVSIVVLSVEGFSELKADEQKERLKALAIDPAAKEEDRIGQYEEWFADQVTSQ